MTAGTMTNRGSRRSGFTLMEITVTVAIILLIMGISLPGIVRIFSAGADSQASNLLAAQLVVARSLAIQKATYVGVHVQMADETARSNLANTCWTAIVVYEDDGSGNWGFVLPKGHQPRRMPGSMAFGELSTSFVQNNGDYKNIANLEDFTTFTIVFDPSGAVVRRVEGNSVTFTPGQPVFSGSKRLWKFAGAKDEDGVMAVTMFDYTEVHARAAAARAQHLNATGQFLAVNVHTGQLFPRK